MTGARRAAIALGTIAAGLFIVACSRGADRLDRASVEKQVARAVADAVEPGVAEVRCPEHIELGAGATVTCDVVLAEPSGTLPVSVVQRDADGHLDVVPQRAVLSAHQIASSLRSGLRARFGRAFQTDCGDEVAKVRAPGQHLLCRASDATSRRSVVVTVEDARGTLSFEVVDP